MKTFYRWPSCHQHQAGGRTMGQCGLEDDMMTTNNRNLTFLVISKLPSLALFSLTMAELDHFQY